MKPPQRSRRPPGKDGHGTDPSPQSLEFVKVYIPSFSSLQLRLPPDFTKQCGCMPRKVVIREPGGRSWNVGMIEKASGLFIRCGWPEFVRDNALMFGDCLVFEYDMCSAFWVRIFGRNGCRKERRGRDFERPVVVKIEDEEIKEEEAPPSLIQSYSGTEDVLGSEEVGHPEEDQMAQGSVAPRHPRWVHRLKGWWIRQPYLSICFLRCHRIELKSKLVLRNERGEKWNVALGTKSDGRLFLGLGWSDFRKVNKLPLNRQCVIEFVVGEDNKCGELRFSVAPRNVKPKL